MCCALRPEQLSEVFISKVNVHRPFKNFVMNVAPRNPADHTWFSLKRRVPLLTALVGLAAVFSAPDITAQASREYDLKAVFLYTLASFVDWPESAFESEDSPFVIGILGVDPFGSVLDEVVKNEFRDGHEMVVRRFRRTDDFFACHVLFVSDSESRRLSRVLKGVEGRPVLTVADLPGFVEGGGMIGFVTTEDRLELLVNDAAATAVELSLSSKLLEVARLINSVAVAQ
jgi:hypothetical protein